MERTFWIGADLAKHTFDVAIAQPGSRPEEWAGLPKDQFPNTPEGMNRFVHWVFKQGIQLEQIQGVCVESTGRISWRWIVELGQRLGAVSMVNPARPRNFAKAVGLRDKTDRVDACINALFGAKMQPAPTRMPCDTVLQLRELSRLHAALDRDRLSYELRLKDGPETCFVRASIQNLIEELRLHLKKLEQEMDRVIQSDAQLREDARRIQTIPGIGPKTTKILLAELGDLRQYSRNEVTALAGLYPKQFTSGSSVHRQSRLAKGGGSRIRKALYMCAMVAVKHNPVLKRFDKHLKAHGKTPMSALGALMRKLLLMARALVVSGKDFDQNFA